MSDYTEDQKKSDDAFETIMDAMSTVYSFRPGRVLSQADYDAIQIYDKESRSLNELATDCFHRGYQQGLLEGGSTDIQKLENKNTKLRSQIAMHKAMRRMEFKWGFIRGAQLMRNHINDILSKGVMFSNTENIWPKEWEINDPGQPTVEDIKTAWKELDLEYDPVPKEFVVGWEGWDQLQEMLAKDEAIEKNE